MIIIRIVIPTNTKTFSDIWQQFDEQLYRCVLRKRKPHSSGNTDLDNVRQVKPDKVNIFS